MRLVYYNRTSSWWWTQRKKDFGWIQHIGARCAIKTWRTEYFPISVFHSVADKVSFLASTRHTVRHIAWSGWKVYFPRSPQFSPEFFRPAGQWGKLKALSASAFSQLSSFCVLVCEVDFGSLVIIPCELLMREPYAMKILITFLSKSTANGWLIIDPCSHLGYHPGFSSDGDAETGEALPSHHREIAANSSFPKTLNEYQDLWQTSRRRPHCSIARIKKHVKFSEGIKDYVDPQLEIAWNSW